MLMNFKHHEDKPLEDGMNIEVILNVFINNECWLSYDNDCKMK